MEATFYLLKWFLYSYWRHGLKDMAFALKPYNKILKVGASIFVCKKNNAFNA